MTYIIKKELWVLSKKIHEEIYFQTQLRTSASSVVETIEKYESNLKSKKRMTLLNSLGTVYVIGIVSLIPLFSLLRFLSIEKTSSNINQLIFTNSLIFGIYYLYIFFILFMGGLMYYVTYMNGKYFKLLQPLPLSTKELSQLSFFVFFRMNMIQVIFILFALPIAGLLLTLNPSVFFVLFLNNLVNTLFIIFILIILSWFLAQRVFNTSEKYRWGSLITMLTMVVYGITVIPIFFLMSKFIHIITDIFNSTGISQQTNEFLSLIPFPLSSGYITSLCLLIPSSSIPTSIIISTIVGFGIYLFLICLIIIKGTSLIGKLNMESELASKKDSDLIYPPVSIKSSSPRIKLIRMNLLMVFRDYSALTQFVMAILFPILIVIMSVIWSKSYMADGITDFVTTMLFFTSGIISFLFLTGSKISERNLIGIYRSLPIKEIDIFRSKQLITTLGSLIPLSFSFIILNLIGSPITFLTMIKIILLYIIVGSELLLLHTILFGKFNNRYTLTVENSENELIKLGILFTFIFITIISYQELIALLSLVTSETAELGMSIILAFTFLFGLDIIAKFLFKESGIMLSQK